MIVMKAAVCTSVLDVVVLVWPFPMNSIRAKMPLGILAWPTFPCPPIRGG